MTSWRSDRASLVRPCGTLLRSCRNGDPTKTNVQKSVPMSWTFLDVIGPVMCGHAAPARRHRACLPRSSAHDSVSKGGQTAPPISNRSDVRYRSFWLSLSDLSSGGTTTPRPRSLRLSRRSRALTARLPKLANTDAGNLNDPTTGSTGLCVGQLAVLCNAGVDDSVPTVPARSPGRSSRALQESVNRPSAGAPVPAIARLTKLEAGTTYRHRRVAANASGTTDGCDYTARTLGRASAAGARTHVPGVVAIAITGRQRRDRRVAILWHVK
jgi:hypothetical protein